MLPSRSLRLRREANRRLFTLVGSRDVARTGRVLVWAVAAHFALARSTEAAQGGCTTEWISKTASGLPALGDSGEPALSSDARFVAFSSIAANLVPGDTNSSVDVFVVDRTLSTIERVSIGTGDVEGNSHSGIADISGDGRYVVMVSRSTNWDPGDIHPGPDIYVRDRLTNTTELISVHLTPPISTSNGSGAPRISPDGRYVVFNHGEDNLVAGDSNGWGDAFLRDRITGVTELVSVDSAGVQSNNQSGSPAISADGRLVAFVSQATNWYPGNLKPEPYVYVRDRVSKTLLPVNLNAQGSLGPGGADWKIDLSDDGRYLVFLYGWLHLDLTPMSSNLLYVRDLVSGTTEPIGYSVFGNKGTPWPPTVLYRNVSISGDGRFVAFASQYDEHVLHSGNRGGINVFLHDRLTGLTQPASLDPNGQWPNLPPSGAIADNASVSSDGTAVAFTCKDPSFGSGNTGSSVYLRSCDWTAPQVYCDSQVNSLGCRPSISFNGLPSASAGSGFTLQTHGLLGNKPGLFFYSSQRAIVTPFLGGYLCMDLPIKYMPAQATGGSGPPGCTGSLSVDFNAWIAGGTDPSLVLGENVCIQAWSRDAGAAWGSNLSNAVAFVIGL
jgi:Tol biopolymer transport system component